VHRFIALAALVLSFLSAGCAEELSNFAAPKPDPDLNNDGTVNILDVSLAASCQGEDPFANALCARADADYDGDIDQADLQFVSDAFGQVVVIDEVPPPVPSVFAPISPTSDAVQTLSGRSEPNSRVTVEGGREPASVRTFGNSIYMVNVPLRVDAVNDLSVRASDRDGNTSDAREVTIVHSAELPPPAPGEASILSIASGDNQEGIAGMPLPRPLEVIASDPGGAPVAGVPVGFSLVLGSATLDGQAAVEVTTDAAGRAEVVMTLGPEPGSHMVRATFPSNRNVAIEFMATGLAADPLATALLRGLVLANDNRGISGVTVTFEGTSANAGVELSTVTNEAGAFRIEDVPPGNGQILDVHGSTATLPGRFTDLSFEIDVLPGQDNGTGRMDFRRGPIFLPEIPDGIEIPIDALGFVTEDRVIESPTEGGGEPVRLVVPAGTHVTFPDGAEQMLSIVRVPVNRVPMALPDGKFTRTVIAIAPAGTLFDPPLPVSFPNLDGIPPGTQVKLLSFVHEVGDFVQVGTATASADGRRVVSDPGSGIRVGAWHGTPPDPAAVTAIICGDLDAGDLSQVEAENCLACECFCNGIPADRLDDRTVCSGEVPVGFSGIQGEGAPATVECVCRKTVVIEIADPAPNDAVAVGSTVTVQGSVPCGADSVTVNGVAATLSGDSWSANVPAPNAPGAFTISATASSNNPVDEPDTTSVLAVAVDASYDTSPVVTGFSKPSTAISQQTIKRRVVATVNPASKAGDVTFTVDNGAVGQASVTVVSTNTTTGKVDLDVMGQSASVAAAGEAKLVAKVDGEDVESANVIVVVPKKQTHAVGPLFVRNEVPGPIMVKSTIGATVTITIQDQFGNTLDSVYSCGTGGITCPVVTEQFSLRTGAFLNNPGLEESIVIPNNTFTNGAKADEASYDNTVTVNGPPLSASERADWIAEVGISGSTNAFHLGPIALSGDAVQTIRVHGHTVTPNFKRTQAVQAANHPPIQATVTDVAVP
jgi:hypothetical protein